MVPESSPACVPTRHTTTNNNPIPLHSIHHHGSSGNRNGVSVHWSTRRQRQQQPQRRPQRNVHGGGGDDGVGLSRRCRCRRGGSRCPGRTRRDTFATVPFTTNTTNNTTTTTIFFFFFTNSRATCTGAGMGPQTVAIATQLCVLLSTRNGNLYVARTRPCCARASSCGRRRGES